VKPSFVILSEAKHLIFGEKKEKPSADVLKQHKKEPLKTTVPLLLMYRGTALTIKNKL